MADRIDSTVTARHMRDTLAQFYPVVHRLARGLSGREDQGRAIVRSTLQRSLRLIHQWDDDTAAERWFLHHTVLSARRAKIRPMEVRKETLIDQANAASGEYVAFIRAIRGLPGQQREAFVLHFAEKCDARKLAIAMDCSTTAAATHLNASTNAMRIIAGERFDSLVAEMARVYRDLTPTERLVLPRVEAIVRRHVWPRRIARLVGWIFTLALVGFLVWISWWIYNRIEI